jgi:hypothetical protein
MKTALNPRSSEKLQYEGRELFPGNVGNVCGGFGEAQATCINTRSLTLDGTTLEISEEI